MGVHGLSAKRCKMPVLSVLIAALTGCWSSSLSSGYTEQRCRGTGKKAHLPVLELPHSHSDAPDGLSNWGQVARTDSYVLIGYRLEPSPKGRAASVLHPCAQPMGVRFSKSVWLRHGNPRIAAGVLGPGRDTRPSGNHLGSSFDFHWKCTKFTSLFPPCSSNSFLKTSVSWSTAHNSMPFGLYKRQSLCICT